MKLVNNSDCNVDAAKQQQFYQNVTSSSFNAEMPMLVWVVE